MEQPFQELREAAFHAVAALCLRCPPYSNDYYIAEFCVCSLKPRRWFYGYPVIMLHRPWFAADVCRCEALMERILDPSSETGSVAASWRYSLVTTLWSTIQVHTGYSPPTYDISTTG